MLGSGRAPVVRRGVRLSDTQATFLTAMREYPEGLGLADAIECARSQGGSYRTFSGCVRRHWIVVSDGLYMLTYLGDLTLRAAETKLWRNRLEQRSGSRSI